MLLNNFIFHVPKSLIAFYPSKVRTNCKLLLINGETCEIKHKIFSNIIDKFSSGDVLVLNNTKVIPARLFGFINHIKKKIEFLVEKIIDDNKILVKIYHVKNILIGTKVFFKKNIEIEGYIIGNQDIFFIIIFYYSQSILKILNQIGYIPLPPYIKRIEEDLDYDMYQTVYGDVLGSIAAPTAGLHFNKNLLYLLSKKGVKICFITLHIGSSTFKPVLEQDITKHIMHSEYVEISNHVSKTINKAKLSGKKIIAVGTSTIRALESAKVNTLSNQIKAICKKTDIFIIPGYHHNIVDTLITNFHFPKSTLIMLICSFLGYKNTMYAYNIAIKKKYHFFSYGDAMLIEKNSQAPYEKN